MNKKKLGVLGLFGVGVLFGPVIAYHGYLFGEAVSGMIFNATTGVLPPPPKRPPKFLMNHFLYRPFVKSADRTIAGMEKEFTEYLKTGKHPMALFPPPGFRDK